MRIALVLSLMLGWVAVQSSLAEDALLPFEWTVEVQKPNKIAEIASGNEQPVKHLRYVDSDRTRTLTLHVSNSSSADVAGITAKVYVIGHMLFPYSQTLKPTRDQKNYIPLYDSGSRTSVAGLDTNYRTMAILNLKPFTIPVGDHADIDIGSVPFHVHIYANLDPIQYHGEDYDGFVIKFFQNDLPLGSVCSSEDSQIYAEAVRMADDEGVKRQNWN